MNCLQISGYFGAYPTCLRDKIVKLYVCIMAARYDSSWEPLLKAFKLTPFDDVKVVILGQDPYHNDGQAHGLSFSVPAGMPLPPSLRNIYKELETDIPGFQYPVSGDLTKWAKQGVLLLNATLT